MYGSEREHETQSRLTRRVTVNAWKSKPKIAVAIATVLISVQTLERKSNEYDELY